MATGRMIIPYSVTLQLISGTRVPIDHNYEFWGNELIIVLDGTADFYRDDLHIPLRKGDIFVLTGNYVKRFCNAKNLQIFNVFFWDLSMQRFEGSFRSMAGYQLLFEQNPRILAYDENHRLRASQAVLDELFPLMQLMEIEIYLRRTGYEQVLNSIFLALITLISRAYSDSENHQVKNVSNLNQAATYMQINFREPLKLEDIAAVACMSERQFTRKFKEIFQQSPIQYLVHQRIIRACAMLEESNHSISEIAMECGFNDINYFSKTFKRAHNMSPSAYRSMRQEQIRTSDWKTTWLQEIN